MPELIVAPPNVARIGYCACEIGMSAFLLVTAEPWRPIAHAVQQWLAVGFGVLLFMAGLEFPWRKVIVDDAAIRERLWFHWRVRELPSHVLIGRTRRGRVAIADNSGRVMFSFVREFGNPSEIEKRLVSFFNEADRLASS